MLSFVNGRLILPEGVREGLSLTTDGDKIQCISNGPPPPNAQVIDLKGLYLSPGFIDIHCHGGGGHDFMDNTVAAMQGALECHMRHGTTTLVPTAVAGSLQELRALGNAVRQFQQSKEARVLPFVPGVHLEGPYISMEMRGAQDAVYIKTPSELPWQDVLEALGFPPLIWTVAAELPGVEALCQALLEKGVRFSIGHSEAEFSQVEQALANGFTMATHLFSAMSTIKRVKGYRVSGVLEAALLLDEIKAELIADGVHVPPELMRLTVKAKGVNGIILVTDAMRGADVPTGEYYLGSLKNGQLVHVDEAVARMPDGINFAGSVATADRLVRTMVQKAGVSIVDAVVMITKNPAEAIGLSQTKGALIPGLDADLVVFDEDIQIHQVIVNGSITY